MDMGEKLRRARMEAGLTQRQLCGDRITRNMLSQIENGKAKPSMKTLNILAQTLGKPVSYFLEEGEISENHDCMLRARAAFEDGRYSAVNEILTEYRGPDGCCDWEMALLKYLSLTAMAEEAAAQGREPVARKLLRQAQALSSPYITEELKRRCYRISGALNTQTWNPEAMGSLDEELFLRSGLALAKGEGLRAGALLEAKENRTGGKWHLRRGEAYLLEKKLPDAVRELQKAEKELTGNDALPLLERCYRELGDFENAYLCACKLRKYTAGG